MVRTGSLFGGLLPPVRVLTIARCTHILTPIPTVTPMAIRTRTARANGGSDLLPF